MTEIASINPATEEVLARFEPMKPSQVSQLIAGCQCAYQTWRRTEIADRAKKIKLLADYFREHRQRLATLITLEMGKPSAQALGEVDKCALACEYYATNGLRHLDSQRVTLEHANATVFFDPIGVVLAVMPWNFPFWQLIRPGIPAILAGNAILLKHAPNVTQCALAIESAFRECGFPEQLLTTLIVDVDAVAAILEDGRVRAVTLTGSDRAGAAIASLAGRNIKKSVLELGGSDAFIVRGDADIDRSVDLAVRARTQNAGQSCIASKRFIIARQIKNAFVQKFATAMSKVRIGDPLDPRTEMGPLARLDLRQTLDRQLQQSVEQGAEIVTGGRKVDRAGYFFPPTVAIANSENVPIWSEETFGPVAAIMEAETDEHAVELANRSAYGLGATICTADVKRGDWMARQLEVGMACINSMVASDPRLPFGGVKRSGFGRELSEFGTREFTNVRTVLTPSA